MTRFRSAITGRWLRKAAAMRRPKTSIRERVLRRRDPGSEHGRQGGRRSRTER